MCSPCSADGQSGGPDGVSELKPDHCHTGTARASTESKVVAAKLRDSGLVTALNGVS